MEPELDLSAAQGAMHGIELADHRNMDQRGWYQLGTTLAQQRQRLDGLGSRQMWGIGDWLVAGEDVVFAHLNRFRVRQLAADLTGYSRHTLAMAASVSRKIPPSMRIDGLSWWHHLAVAKLEVEEQRRWLEQAAELEWSVRRLRTELRDAQRTRPSSLRSSRLVGELLKLRRQDIPAATLSELRSWVQRELLDGD